MFKSFQSWRHLATFVNSVLPLRGVKNPKILTKKRINLINYYLYRTITLLLGFVRLFTSVSLFFSKFFLKTEDWIPVRVKKFFSSSRLSAQIERWLVVHIDSLIGYICSCDIQLNTSSPICSHVYQSITIRLYVHVR